MLRLVGVGVGVEEFQWSEDEQVWPFERGVNGETLYCKEVNFGALPNNGTKTVAHGISNFKTFDAIVVIEETAGNQVLVKNASVTSIDVLVSTCRIVTNTNVSMFNAKFRLIYLKT